MKRKMSPALLHFFEEGFDDPKLKEKNDVMAVGIKVPDIPVISSDGQSRRRQKREMERKSNKKH